MLPAIASRARSSLVIAGAAGTIAAAALMSVGGKPAAGFECAGPTADDGMRLEARLATSQILTGDQNVAITIQAPEVNSIGRIVGNIQLRH